MDAGRRMLPPAAIRTCPEDFVVEEIPAYPACGEGEHAYVTIRKRGVTTLDAVRALCRALDVDERGAGYAGMKDRHAVTTQTVSLAFPLSRSLDEIRELSLEGIEILRVERHRNKLKPGHLLGNRFAIVLREIPEGSVDQVIAALEKAGREGVPNAFGPQRFGRSGDNADRALAWLTGKIPGPRNPKDRRLIFSALQAHVFNEVLARRIELGCWATPIEGDLLKKENGAIFLCTDVEADRERALRGEVSPTGPIFGARMRWPEKEAAEIEREVLLRTTGALDTFDRHRQLGEGSRRSLRLMPTDLRVERLAEDAQSLRVAVVLPKGGYATTVLAQAVTLEDRSAPRRHPPLSDETGHDDTPDPEFADQG